MLIEVRKHHILTSLNIEINNESNLLNELKNNLDRELLVGSDDDIKVALHIYKEHLIRLNELKTQFAQEIRK